MAHLNERQYAYRAESAARRNAANSEIAMSNGMPEDIAEMVTELCGLRHHLHCNTRAYAIGERTECNRNAERLQTIRDTFDSEGLPVFVAPDDIDTESVCRAAGEDRDIDDIMSDWYALNDSIESCLGEIDKAFGTRFCPTGALRIF